MAVVMVAVVLAGAFVFEVTQQPQVAIDSSASQANANIYGVAYITVWFTLTNSGQVDGIATVNLVVVKDTLHSVVAQERYLVPAHASMDFQLSVPWPFYLGSTSDLGSPYADLVSVVKA